MQTLGKISLKTHASISVSCCIWHTLFLEKKTNTSDVRDNLLIKASAKQLQMETLFLQSLSVAKS